MNFYLRYVIVCRCLTVLEAATEEEGQKLQSHHNVGGPVYVDANGLEVFTTEDHALPCPVKTEIFRGWVVRPGP